jgi:hypothetical protein
MFRSVGSERKSSSFGFSWEGFCELRALFGERVLRFSRFPQADCFLLPGMYTGILQEKVHQSGRGKLLEILSLSALRYRRRAIVQDYALDGRDAGAPVEP